MVLERARQIQISSPLTIWYKRRRHLIKAENHCNCLRGHDRAHVFSRLRQNCALVSFDVGNAHTHTHVKISQPKYQDLRLLLHCFVAVDHWKAEHAPSADGVSVGRVKDPWRQEWVSLPLILTKKLQFLPCTEVWKQWYFTREYHQPETVCRLRHKQTDIQFRQQQDFVGPPMKSLGKARPPKKTTAIKTRKNVFAELACESGHNYSHSFCTFYNNCQSENEIYRLSFCQQLCWTFCLGKEKVVQAN